MHEWEFAPANDKPQRKGPRWRCALCGGLSYRAQPGADDHVVLDAPWPDIALTCAEAVAIQVMGS